MKLGSLWWRTGHFRPRRPKLCIFQKQLHNNAQFSEAGPPGNQILGRSCCETNKYSLTGRTSLSSYLMCQGILRIEPLMIKPTTFGLREPYFDVYLF
jgi:hypothetical protein